ncbi:MAG: carbonic anhydrase family protein, partial [Rivularia sp. ALOHA_DT_140]|nr:carbonic anhydrase family protein [Rivularia sp. ALOHA_DT_140]
MDRRKLLKKGFIAATGIAASSLFGCNSLSSGIKEKGKTHWGYIGKEGPENWGNLSADFKVCQTGKSQSPVNLKLAVNVELPNLEIDYKDTPLRIINNGHTIQINYQPGSFLTLDNEAYELLQLHFHHPSEQKIQGV